MNISTPRKLATLLGLVAAAALATSLTPVSLSAQNGASVQVSVTVMNPGIAHTTQMGLAAEAQRTASEWDTAQGSQNQRLTSDRGVVRVVMERAAEAQTGRMAPQAMRVRLEFAAN